SSGSAQATSSVLGQARYPRACALPRPPQPITATRYIRSPSSFPVCAKARPEQRPPRTLRRTQRAPKRRIVAHQADRLTALRNLSQSKPVVARRLEQGEELTVGVLGVPKLVDVARTQPGPQQFEVARDGAVHHVLRIRVPA